MLIRPHRTFIRGRKGFPLCLHNFYPRGRTQRHAVGAKVRVFVRNPDELANERAELARLLNKAGTCFLHEMSLSTASGWVIRFGSWGYTPPSTRRLNLCMRDAPSLFNFSPCSFPVVQRQKMTSLKIKEIWIIHWFGPTYTASGTYTDKVPVCLCHIQVSPHCPFKAWTFVWFPCYLWCPCSVFSQIWTLFSY
jgi:hypothetical protein